MKRKLFIYACVGLALLNLVSVFVYRFRLNKSIDEKFLVLAKDIALLEVATYETITNYCASTVGIYTNFNGDLKRSLPDLSPDNLNIASSPAKIEPKLDDYTLEYTFFTSRGCPWVELEGEYYTLDDEILGYGIISNCSRVAIVLHDGSRIYNKLKPQKNIGVVKND